MCTQTKPRKVKLMSTKKVKTPSKKKDEKLTKAEKKMLDSLAVKVAKDHEGMEKPQLLVSAEPKKYLVDEIRATKFDMDDDGILCRKVVEVSISSDEDLSNKPEEANEAIEDGKKKIVEDGFFLSDKEAMDESLFKIEGMVARLATDIEYGKGCRCCATNGLRSVNLALRKLRKFREFRDELQSMIDPKKGSLPAVLPSKKHSDEYAIVDGVFKHVGPKVSIRKIELDDEQKDKLSKILSAVTGEDLDGKTGGLIEVKENNK
jgi:hypothetical protein